jgi:hypothetical protein
MNRLLPILYLFFLALTSAAQEAASFTLTRQMLEVDSMSLFDVAGYYCDSSGRLRWEEALERSEAFSPLPGRDHGFESRYVHWVLFRVDSRAAGDTLDRMLWVSMPFRTYIHQFDSRGRMMTVSGQVNRPFRGFSGHYDLSVLKILPGEETTFLLQIDNRPKQFRKKAEKIQMALLSAPAGRLLGERWLLDRMGVSVFTGVFLGVLFFLILFAGFMYLENRESPYLYYALYVGSIFVYYLMRRTYVIHSPISYLNGWRMHLEGPLLLLTFLGYVYFIERFLNVDAQRQPHLARSLRVGKVLLPGLMGLGFVTMAILPLHEHMQFFRWVHAVLFLAGGWVVFRVYQEGGKLGRFILGGTLALVLGGSLILITDLIRRHFGIVLNVRAVSYAQLGILAETFIFALGLGYRTRIMREEKTQAELKALKAQMNPHFVFNSLNSIKDLIQKHKPDEAVQYLTKFSRLMRGVLRHSEDALMPLEEELEMCRHYLTLEALRFDHRFSFEVESEEELADFPIPPLIFQPFLENAIWHGLLPKEEGERWVRLRLFSRGRELVAQIEDNGIGRKTAGSEGAEPGSFGVRLVRDRLQRLFPGARVSFSDKFDTFGKPSGTLVEITMPNP